MAIGSFMKGEDTIEGVRRSFHGSEANARLPGFAAARSKEECLYMPRLECLAQFSGSQ